MAVNSVDSLLESSSFHDVIGDDILQVLKCGICMEYYTCPVILSCGHTFCYTCLLDMGNYAEAHQINTSLRDLTIGCPNCRQPVFVMSVKAKRMTQNYPIASLVEGLRSRPCATKTTVDSSTNTDPRPEAYPEILYQFDTQKADQACRDYEQYMNANTSRGSVISDAKGEIDAIRAQGVTDLQRIHVPDVNLELRPDLVHTTIKPTPTRSPGKRKKARASRELCSHDLLDSMFQPNSRNPAFSDVQPSFNRMS